MPTINGKLFRDGRHVADVTYDLQELRDPRGGIGELRGLLITERDDLAIDGGGVVAYELLLEDGGHLRCTLEHTGSGMYRIVPRDQVQR